MLGHVWTDTSVSWVGATATLLSRTDLDMLDDKILSVKILEFCIALRILQEAKDDLTGLYWRTSLGCLEGFTLKCAAGTASVLTETDALFLLHDVSQRCLRRIQGHTLDCLGTFKSVLEMGTQIDTHGLA